MVRALPPAPPARRRVRPTPSWRGLRSAFSLVEILVALTLVGLIAGLSIPKLSKLANQSRVQRATQAIQTELQQAFAIAGRNRAPVTIRWNGTAAELRVTNLTGTQIYRRASVRGFGISGSEVTMTPATLTVFPNGLANDSLVVSVNKRGYARTIRLSRSGMVRSR